MDPVISPRAVLIGAVTIAALAVFYGGLSGPMRMLPTLAFMLIVPGLAWCGRLGRMNILGLVAVAVSLSLAMEIATGSVLLVVGLWSPSAGLWVLVAATIAGLICARTNDQLSSHPAAGKALLPSPAGDYSPQPRQATVVPSGNHACPSKVAADSHNIDEPVLIVCAACANRTERSYGWLLANPSLKCSACGREMTRERCAVVAYVEGIRRLLAQVPVQSGRG
jgi:hypothetical protein